MRVVELLRAPSLLTKLLDACNVRPQVSVGVILRVPSWRCRNRVTKRSVTCVPSGNAHPSF